MLPKINFSPLHKAFSNIKTFETSLKLNYHILNVNKPLSGTQIILFY